jgi:hypothetical protein
MFDRMAHPTRENPKDLSVPMMVQKLMVVE